MPDRSSRGSLFTSNAIARSGITRRLRLLISKTGIPACLSAEGQTRMSVLQPSNATFHHPPAPDHNPHHFCRDHSHLGFDPSCAGKFLFGRKENAEIYRE